MTSLQLSERRAERWALLALILFTAIAVGGYWNFALHPERLPQTPAARSFFAISFPFFGRVHIALSALALGVVLMGRIGVRWIPAMAAVYTAAFLAEHLGTAYGVPFGEYAYTGLLGPRLGERVPALIPLSWFLMGFPAWVVARAAFPTSAVRRVVVAAYALVVWDLALDPAMSYLTPYWLWKDKGPYYGMPWVNLVGWFATGLVIMLLLERLKGILRLEELPVRWMAAYYLAVLLMPVGMLLAAGHGLALAVTGAGLGVGAWLVRAAWRSSRLEDSAQAALSAPEAAAPRARTLAEVP